jgi:protease IV
MENNPPPIHRHPQPYSNGPRSTARRSNGWKIAAIVFAALAFVFFVGNLVQSMSSLSGGTFAGRQSGRMLEEIIVEQNRSANKIAIVDVQGLISGHSFDRSGRNMVDLIADQFRMASRDDAVKAVILKVDSPGGTVMASDDIAALVRKFQKEHKKPVVASLGGLAASGGYYVAVPSQWIVANELTITGSIGVIMQSFNYRGLMDKVGLTPMVFKSGRFKDMLRGSKTPEEIDPEEKQMIQEMIDETHERFKAVVANGREAALGINGESGRPLAPDWDEYADGRILTGNQAYQIGFVDELGNFETAVERTRQISGIEDANLVRYQEIFTLSRLFSIFGSAEQASIKIDLGLEVPRLEPGRLYFLSGTVLH